MKRAVLYVRVSSVDQNPEAQLLDLRQFAAQRGLQIVETYSDHGGERGNPCCSCAFGGVARRLV